ncbi:MAG: hypothetical protein HON68_08235 [Gammaproteobacteria bacterium]|jgi:hypothetical protein|nr:hypothetical protein [Gammaproteobacteria bacterium]MBT5465772.1 hypothetical protein [Candidatus Neomarinimicrobiota bacterium]MBT3489972.1 hypothetical protein [Gammaproteobacteria bacterium]MBT3719224.1 hypothetical protein [Gammaproteobacteria bacterium]MBT4300797.1 hypothetical protein [Gammaproteobacteria bacterium]
MEGCKTIQLQQHEDRNSPPSESEALLNEVMNRSEEIPDELQGDEFGDAVVWVVEQLSWKPTQKAIDELIG